MGRWNDTYFCPHKKHQMEQKGGKKKVRIERVGPKPTEEKVEELDIEAESKKRTRDEESSNAETDDTPEWEETSVDKWEASSGVSSLHAMTCSHLQKKLKTIEVEFDVRVIEDIDFKVS